MAESFLWRYFRQGLFPSRVLALIIEIYGSRYGAALAQSHTLGSHALDLLPYLDDKKKCLLISKSGNIAALDAVLSDPGTSSGVLATVASAWRLSVIDQRRLLERNLDDHTLRALLTQMEPTHYVVKIWQERFNYDPATHGIQTVKRSPHTSTPKDGIPWVSANDHYTGPPHTIADLVNVVSGLHFYSGLINHCLGDGSTEQSLDCWRIFFALAQNDPDVDIELVLQTASCLAFTSD